MQVRHIDFKLKQDVELRSFDEMVGRGDSQTGSLE